MTWPIEKLLPFKVHKSLPDYYLQAENPRGYGYIDTLYRDLDKLFAEAKKRSKECYEF